MSMRAGRTVASGLDPDPYSGRDMGLRVGGLSPVEQHAEK
jgi:hypothetical protein